MNKIISLVPSITLTLFDLGLEENITGRTKFCIHPKEKVAGIPTVGGTKKLNLEKIRSLKPDLIIANKEENEKEQIETLQKEFNVFVTDVKNIEDNYQMIAQLGELTGTSDKAKTIIETTKQNFDSISTFSSRWLSGQMNTLYLIWRKPYMSIGHDTFIHSMLEKIGLKNIFAEQTRYPVISQLSTVDCQLVLLSSEPYPFSDKHITEIQEQLPDAKILLVDGEFFSWYGSKMQDAPAYFRELLSSIDP